jgi:hypothetical protein
MIGSVGSVGLVRSVSLPALPRQHLLRMSLGSGEPPAYRSVTSVFQACSKSVTRVLQECYKSTTFFPNA